MNWRKTITKEKTAEKEVKKPFIRAAPHWKNTIRPEGDYIKGLKGDKGDKGEKGDKGDRGQKGEQGNPGKNGQNGSFWFFFDERLNDSVGKNYDLALVKKTAEFYQKKNGKWQLEGSFKVAGDSKLMVGGVSENYVLNQIAEAIADIPAGSVSIDSTTTNIIVTTQDVLICKTGCTSIQLKNASTATKPIVIKNFTGGDLTISVDGGANIDDETAFIIPNKTAFEFAPEGGQYYAY